MATYNFNTSSPSPSVSTRSAERSLLSKSFTYMMLLLLITVAVSVGLSCFLQYAVGDVAQKTYVIMLSTSAILQIILTFWIMFGSLRQSKTAVIPMVLYAICMGVLISSFGFVLDWWTIASAFGIAALSFGAMALIGTNSKNASGMGMVGFGLLISVLIGSLFNFILFMLVPQVWTTVNIVTSILVIIAIMLITAYDVYNIKRISQAGMNSSNLALYLAFNLYLDFIVILVRLLQLLAILGANNRR